MIADWVEWPTISAGPATFNQSLSGQVLTNLLSKEFRTINGTSTEANFSRSWEWRNEYYGWSVNKKKTSFTQISHSER